MPSGNKKQPIRRSPEEVQEWLVKHLAEAMDLDPAAIDVSAPFETLGVDSVTAIGMTGHLEEWLNVTIDPTVIYDYPTIEELAAYLAKLTTPD